jgi:hypothetical protein
VGTKKYTKTLDAEDWQLMALLYNFDMASPELKQPHKDYLDFNVKRYLKKGFSATIVGLASPTGPDAFNKTLSQARAQEVAKAVRQIDSNGVLGTFEFAGGETLARLRGLPNGAESDAWRGVFLWLSDPDRKPKPREHFYELLYIYDATDQGVLDMVRKDQGVQTYMLPVRGGTYLLSELLEGLLRSGKRFRNVVFITHGRAGMIGFDNNELGVEQLDRYFTDKGLERLFPKYTRMYFAGCNAAVGEEGWKFLEAAGRLFLKVGGGEVFGWTSYGFAMRNQVFMPGRGRIVHPWGKVRSVFIKPGGEVHSRKEHD